MLSPRKPIVLPTERARQRFQLADAKSPLVHGGDEFRTNRAGYTGDGNDGIVLHFWSRSGNKKAPDLFGLELRVQMMRSSVTRARLPRPQRGACRFSRCVWCSSSWRRNL